MTVHSLPQVDSPRPVNRTTGRWTMLAVMLACAAPVIASYYTYYVIRPEGRRVYGDLIDPQRPLPAVQARALGGAAVALPSLRGQWLIVTVADAACDERCQNHLYLQRQIREGLGREKDRVDRVWLIPDAGDVPQSLVPAVKDATVLRVDAAALSAWLAPAAGKALGDHLYLVDPMGNWMMRFPAGMDVTGAAQAKRDISRVLRASASWDNAGREPAKP